MSGERQHRAAAARVAGFLLALGGLWLTPARAQDNLLVKNTDQEETSAQVVPTSGIAQRIRTGPEAAGYDIASVGLSFATRASTGTTTVEIRGDSSGDPSDTALFTLDTPASSAGLNEFTHSETVHLDANTVYWIVARHSNGSGPRWRRTVTDPSVDTESQSGWSIPVPFERLNTDGAWTPSSQRALPVRILGSVATRDDEETLPTVTVTSRSSTVAEGIHMLFTVSRTGPTTSPLAVMFNLSETGDMLNISGDQTSTIPAGDSFKELAYSTDDDNDNEPDSTVTFRLQVNPAYTVGTPGSASITVKDNDNADPTGLPTISDTTPQVGDPLTAVTSGIGDPDGLTSPTFTWQWVRVSGGSETDIVGATSDTYTVVDADVGATLKVRVGFADDEGHAETVESAETETVEAAAPLPMVTVAPGTTPVTEGTAATFTVARAVVTTGALTVRYSVSESGDVVAAGEEGAQTIAFADDATTVTVTVPTEDDNARERSSAVTVTLTEDAAYVVGADSSAVVTVEDGDNSPPTGTASLENTTPMVGEEMEVDPSAISDPDGESTAFRIRWIRVASDNSETEVGTGIYTVTVADVGSRLKARVSYTDGFGTVETVDSALSDVVPGEPLPSVSVAPGPTPVTEGTAATFTVTRTVVTTGALTVNYSVSESGDMVASGEENAKTVMFADGDTSKTVTVPTEGDSAHEDNSTVTVTLTADDAYEIGTGAATVVVEDDDNAAPTGELTIDDTTPVVGEVLTAETAGITDPDGLTGATFTYRWIRVAGGAGDRGGHG